MSVSNPYAVQSQTIYQAHPATLQSIQAAKAKVLELSMQCMHRNIRVQMIHGQQLEGTLVHLDSQYMYLKVEGNPEAMREVFNPYYNPYTSSIILPVVLYELLVITLLD
jgi:hypothetical protein